MRKATIQLGHLSDRTRGKEAPPIRTKAQRDAHIKRVARLTDEFLMRGNEITICPPCPEPAFLRTARGYDGAAG